MTEYLAPASAEFRLRFDLLLGELLEAAAEVTGVLLEAEVVLAQGLKIHHRRGPDTLLAHMTFLGSLQKDRY